MTIVSTSSVGCEGIFRRNVLSFTRNLPCSQAMSANHQTGMKYLLQAAESGHRAAMIEVARALDVGETGECVDVEEEDSQSNYSRY